MGLILQNFYPIFKMNSKIKEVYVVRSGNLRFDGIIAFPKNQDVNHYNHYNIIMIMLFLGSSFFLILYHLGNYIVTKNKNFLYYILFNGLYIFIIGTFSLVFNKYLNVNFIEEKLMFFAGLTAAFSSIFARNFLDFKTFLDPKKIKRLKVIEYTLVACSIIHLISYKE